MNNTSNPLKKIVLSAFVIVTYSLYATIHYYVLGSNNVLLSNNTIPTISATPIATTLPTPHPSTTTQAPPTVTPTNIATAIPSASSTPPPTPVPTPAGKFRDGQYTGIATDAYYGTMQVKAIIQGGKLTDVQFLQYPSDRSRSVEINNYALPILRSEAINAQSAQVDAVTGASASSPAFMQSLDSALTQAKA